MKLLSRMCSLTMIVLAMGVIMFEHPSVVHAPVKLQVGSYVDARPDIQRMIPRPRPTPSPTPVALHPVVKPPAPPMIITGSTQQALINQDRTGSNLGPLTWNGCLLNVAKSNASRMVAQNAISHANGADVDLACGLGHQAAENVGFWSSGINDVQLNIMFMGSPEHRTNILGPYHYVATAWGVALNGYGYVAVEFS